MDASEETRKERERSDRSQRAYWAYWVAFASALLVALLAFAFSVRNGSQQVVRHEGKFPRERSALSAYSGSERGAPLPLRPLFPYSVIPGGAHSAKELRYAVAHDAVVANHYADFDLAKAHVVRLDRNLTAYVSFRLGDRVYWTRRKLTLLKGEKIITDGKHEARTRCGNRISVAPSEPVSPKEPSEEAMEAPPALERYTDGDPELEMPPISPAALIRSVQTPSGDPPEWGSLPPYFPIVGAGGSGSPLSPPPVYPPPPANPPPVATPEPDTLLLLVTGILACLSLRLRAQSYRKREA